MADPTVPAQRHRRVVRETVGPAADLVVHTDPVADVLGELVVRAIAERHPELGGENRTVTNGRTSVTPLDVLRGALAGAGAHVIVRVGLDELFQALSREAGLGGAFPREFVEAIGVQSDAQLVELVALMQASPPIVQRASDVVQGGATRPPSSVPPAQPPTDLPLVEVAAAIAERVGERLTARLVEQFAPSFLEWLGTISATPAAIPRRPRRRGTAARAARAPQATFPAARELGLALADGPTGRYWTALPADVGIVHALAGATLRTELVGSAMAEWFGAACTPPALLAELQRAGLPAVLLLNEAIALVLEHRDYVEIALDDLIPAAGWSRPRSAKERTQMRARIWRWLTIFHAARVIGGRWRTRPGRAGDPVPMRDSLVVIGGIPAEGGQLALDGSEVPEWVSLGAGPYLAEHRGNRRMLTDVGSVRRIAAIPAGKPAGAWAQAIALTLNQHWRTHAASPGRAQHLSREQLLDTFQPQPTVHEILTSPNPDRARRYFTGALRDARLARAIGRYVEPPPLPGRQGWAEAWLRERVDIQPPGEVADDLSAIAAAAARNRPGQPV
jgi:hypothetical protein